MSLAYVQIENTLGGIDAWRHDLRANSPLSDDEMDSCVVLFICRKKRHRSVAAKHLTNEVRGLITEYFGARCELGPRDTFPVHMCNHQCSSCKWATQAHGHRTYESREEGDRLASAIALFKGRNTREISYLDRERGKANQRSIGRRMQCSCHSRQPKENL